MNFYGVVALVLLSLLSSVVATDIEGKRWAILVAGSNGYGNYRHQADVCHAYQVLKKGGLKDENIIVFMYDDIAFDTENPRPGTIINKPYGTDVYYGVPKDYCGENATADNLYAVILGNKSALTGGSGKVLESGPDDYVFIYYSDHGSPGLVGMPSGDPVYAKDLIDVLKKKHEANSYKSMVIYIEACESGSMFEGILPENWNIYGVTASNASQSSFGTYCPFEYPSSPSEYGTCLGDLFSIAWLEDSDKHDLSKEALAQQYQLVRRRTGFDTPHQSQVEQYGDKSLANDFIFKYIGTNPANDNITGTDVASDESQFLQETKGVVNQRDASLVYLRNKFNKAPKGSHEKLEAKKKLLNEISDRKRIDRNINNIISLLFGRENGEKVVETVRPSGQPLVDDWGCLKMLVKVYEEHCGSLSTYGRKYTRAMANMCNLGIDIQKMIMAANRTCVGHNAKTT